MTRASSRRNLRSNSAFCCSSSLVRWKWIRLVKYVDVGDLKAPGDRPPGIEARRLPRFDALDRADGQTGEFGQGFLAPLHGLTVDFHKKPDFGGRHRGLRLGGLSCAVHVSLHFDTLHYGRHAPGLTRQQPDSSPPARLLGQLLAYRARLSAPMHFIQHPADPPPEAAAVCRPARPERWRLPSAPR